MKRVVPDWYPQFQCTASACRHSCCIGWEVDVDGGALARYQQVEGPFGERLRANIAPGECPHFILGEGERCPFLNGENLCDIYIELGEDALCQICSDHPRWRNWFADRVEEGLGLCCEEAARLLLTHPNPVKLIELPMEGEAEEGDKGYLALLEQRQLVLRLLQDRRKSLSARLDDVCFLYGIQGTQRTLQEDVHFLLGLEILDSAWGELLKQRLEPRWDGAWDRDGEHLMCYLIQRYFLSWGLERWAEDFPIRFGLFSLRLLGALYAAKDNLTLEDRVEFIRAWSAELEYSEENLEAVAAYLL